MSSSATSPGPTFEGVRAVALANVYFNGGVVSHTIFLADGAKRTLGVVFPGKYEFSTAVRERLEITAGECEVTLPGAATQKFATGTAFDVPAGVSFQIQANAIAQYICSYF
jgi:purine/pyrimidine-nucleoside phosphorylase